ncbi:MAG TPA: molybdopterin cofactor-binding domain-containing protein, partial [Gemmatimonadales bacterium]|nr:molybdopterin cofactor-binding domain-containing protein [Gemmatimonadales bacterium]
IRNFLPKYREIGASVRALLEAAAAKHWNVPQSEVTVQLHEVLHKPSGRRVGFGELVAIAKDLPLPAAESLTYKETSAYRYVGKEIPIVDLWDMTTGKAIYGQDVRRDGMKFAVVLRPPVYGATLKTLDSSEAEKVTGVEKVFAIPYTAPPSGFNALGGIAIVATNTWAALEARKKLQVTWTNGANESLDSQAYRADLEKAAGRKGQVARSQGNAAAAIARSVKKVRADYYLPYLAHAQMEPPAATAAWGSDDSLEIWACTQHPQGARDQVAQALKMPVEKVTVHVTLLGGAFGRKSFPDFVCEAALIAREIQGTVKVVWSREDDIQHGFYHAAAAEHLEAGLDSEGKVTGWLHRSALPPINGQFAPHQQYQAAFETGMGMSDLPFDLTNYQAESGPADVKTRIGWFRSVININHSFAINSFVDELAHAAGKDPKAFRLELLGPDRLIDLRQVGINGDPWNYGATPDQHQIDTARYRKVVEALASSSGWGTSLPTGEGRGMAVHRSFLSYVGAVAHVKVGADGEVQVPRMDVVIDAGFVAHPERVRAQMEGATIMAMSSTLFSELTFARGTPVQSNYTDYRVARFNEAPRQINVTIIPSDAPPGGVGEPGIPPIGPAITNAIFAATGKRIRSLPVGDQLKTTT